MVYESLLTTHDIILMKYLEPVKHISIKYIHTSDRVYIDNISAVS